MIIVAESQSEWTLVTQGDHARFAAQLLASWQLPRIAEIEHHDALLFAVREHDNGWREIDAAPLLHPEGDRPHDFLSLPEADRRALWERATSRYEAANPLAALLITEHALHLLSGTGEGEAAEAGLLERRERLLEHTQYGESELAELYSWLALADWLSLVACNQWSEPFQRSVQAVERPLQAPEMVGVWRDGSLLLDPFPLAGATTFDLPIRRIPRRQWLGDRDLGTAVMSAVWQQASLRVAAMPKEK